MFKTTLSPNKELQSVLPLFKSYGLCFGITSRLSLNGLDRLRVTLVVSDHWNTITQNIDLYDSNRVDALVCQLSASFRVNPGHLRLALKTLIKTLERLRLEQLEATTSKSSLS